MGERLIESLEARQLLSAAGGSTSRAAHTAAPAALSPLFLSTANVETILGHAASQAASGQVIVVVDRESTVLGTYAGSGVDPDEASAITLLATQRAATAAAFQSTQNAFTTRTARFIIQNHFPQPVRRTEGGPLYGVEFSSFPGSDILLPANQTGISGDPGGIPLYLNGVPVGGIGVAGDGVDFAPSEDLAPELKEFAPIAPYESRALGDRFFDGREERDLDESVALAGSKGFDAPRKIRATQIFVNGLRLPYTRSPRARGQADRSLAALTSTGAGTLATPIIAGTPRLTNGEVEGFPGLFRNREAAGATVTQEATRTPINALIDSDDPEPNHLLAADVAVIMDQAVRQSLEIRAAIRKPNGVPAQVHVVVVDRDGTVLGVFRMEDGTNFSYDVAVQKARTAAFFSDDAHAISTRAVGFMSQKFFPPGQEHSLKGPFYQLQDKLTFDLVTDPNDLLPNGITLFPGGVPLYKNGQLVGAVGVSGDGVDQDDLIAFAGTENYRADDTIRSDKLGEADATDFIMGKITQIVTDAGIPFDTTEARRLLTLGLDDTQLPYVKFPRNPNRK